MAISWRSMLYVPSHVDRYVDAAHARGADCIVLDLEDSVPPDRKMLARERAAAAAPRLAGFRCGVAVRINAPARQAVADIDAVVGPSVQALVVPKAGGPGHIRLLDEWVSDAEAKQGLVNRPTRLIPLIETSEAFFEMRDIARASDRVAALMMGGEDLALDGGFEPSEETLLFPKQQMVLSAAAAGVAPLGLLGGLAGFGNLDDFRTMVARSRRFGFVGATCIHPDQVPILNAEFTPTDAEVAYAQRIVQANQVALDEGRGSFAIDGRMIDAPIVRRALALLERRAAIEAMTPSGSSALARGS